MKSLTWRNAMAAGIAIIVACSPGGGTEDDDDDGSGSKSGASGAGAGTPSASASSAISVGSGAGTGGSTVNPDAACNAVTEEAKQAYAPADIIWAVDTSGSMVEESLAVQLNINTFSQQIV